MKCGLVDGSFGLLHEPDERWLCPLCGRGSGFESNLRFKGASDAN